MPSPQIFSFSSTPLKNKKTVGLGEKILMMRYLLWRIRFVMQILIAVLWRAVALDGRIMLVALLIVVSGLPIVGVAFVTLRAHAVGNMTKILPIVMLKLIVNGVMEREILGASRIGV